MVLVYRPIDAVIARNIADSQRSVLDVPGTDGGIVGENRVMQNFCGVVR